MMSITERRLNDEAIDVLTTDIRNFGRVRNRNSMKEKHPRGVKETKSVQGAQWPTRANIKAAKNLISGLRSCN
jgi:hypothetical protein